jgi:hypothetical protein
MKRNSWDESGMLTTLFVWMLAAFYSRQKRRKDE